MSKENVPPPYKSADAFVVKVGPEEQFDRKVLKIDSHRSDVASLMQQAPNEALCTEDIGEYGHKSKLGRRARGCVDRDYNGR